VTTESISTADTEDRQGRVLSLVLGGQTDRQIAETLSLPQHIVAEHLVRLERVARTTDCPDLAARLSAAHGDSAKAPPAATPDAPCPSAGKPVLHTEVRIVRPDGSDADVGELGELWVKGPNITPGYWNRPEANKTSFTDGWLHTGDATRVDEEGFYYIVDRWKDMYISGGENVYPAEVENVLHQLNAIAEAAVIGIPDAQWGEVGLAIVAVKPGQKLTEGEVFAHCAANLARFKCPLQIRFVDALPRNATGKIHKPTLRKEFSVASEIDKKVANA